MKLKIIHVTWEIYSANSNSGEKLQLYFYVVPTLSIETIQASNQTNQVNLKMIAPIWLGSHILKWWALFFMLFPVLSLTSWCTIKRFAIKICFLNEATFYFNQGGFGLKTDGWKDRIGPLSRSVIQTWICSWSADAKDEQLDGEKPEGQPGDADEGDQVDQPFGTLVLDHGLEEACGLRCKSQHICRLLRARQFLNGHHWKQL